MWRLVEKLEGKGKNTCLYVGQEISFLGSVAARVTTIHVNGKKVSSAVLMIKASIDLIF
jgi:DEP domain-containing protein 5